MNDETTLTPDVGHDANGSPETELPVPAIAKPLKVVDTRSSQMEELPQEPAPAAPSPAPAAEVPDGPGTVGDAAVEAAAAAAAPHDASLPINPPAEAPKNQIPAQDPRFTLERLKQINEVDVIGNGEGGGTAVFDSEKAELIPGIAAILLGTLMGMAPSATVHMEVDIPDGQGVFHRKVIQVLLPVRRLYLCNHPRAVKPALKFKRLPDNLWAAHLQLADRLPDVSDQHYLALYQTMKEREQRLEAAGQAGGRAAVNTQVPGAQPAAAQPAAEVTDDVKRAWNVILDYIRAERQKNPNFNSVDDTSPPHVLVAVGVLRDAHVSPQSLPQNGFIVAAPAEPASTEPTGAPLVRGVVNDVIQMDDRQGAPAAADKVWCEVHSDGCPDNQPHAVLDGGVAAAETES